MELTAMIAVRARSEVIVGAGEQRQGVGGTCFASWRVALTMIWIGVRLIRRRGVNQPTRRKQGWGRLGLALAVARGNAGGRGGNSGLNDCMGGLGGSARTRAGSVYWRPSRNKRRLYWFWVLGSVPMADVGSRGRGRWPAAWQGERHRGGGGGLAARAKTVFAMEDASSCHVGKLWR